MTEAEFAAGIVAKLADLNWDVYQEVSTGYGAPRADIVAIQRFGTYTLSWIIEVKLSFSLTVIEQAIRWRKHQAANYVSIATPNAQTRFRNRIRVPFKYPGVKDILDEMGINVFAFEPRLPRFYRCNRFKSLTILNFLNDNQKDMALAGTKGESYYTKFSWTCRLICEYLKEFPGATIKEVVKNVAHHYSNDTVAARSIFVWLREGKIKGFEQRRVNGKIGLYLKEEK